MATQTSAQVVAGAPSSHQMTAVDGRIMAGVRIAIGMMWLTNIGWKTPPDFGILRNYTAEAVSHPVFAPYSWLVEHVILPNFVPFAWSVLLTECIVAACLVLGLFTRAAALVGAVQSLAVGLSVALAPNEWPWSYYLMVAAHLAVYATAAGRVWGLDALIRPVLVDRSGRLARLGRWAT